MYSIVDRESKRDITPGMARAGLGLVMVLGLATRVNWTGLTIPLQLPEQAYLNSLRNLFLEPAFWCKSPLFALLGAVLLSSGVPLALGLRWVSVLAGLISIPAVYLAGKEMASRRTGFYAALLYALYPAVVLIQRLILPLNIGLPFLLYGFYWIMRGLYRQERKSLYIAACLLVGGLGFTLEAVLLLPLLLAAAAYIERKEIFYLGILVFIPALFLAILQFFLAAVNLNPLANFWHGIFAMLGGLIRFWFIDIIIFLGWAGLFFLPGKKPLSGYYAALVFSLAGIGFAGLGSQNFALNLAYPFILLGSGRMVQVILDNSASFINTLMNVPGDPRRLQTPGKIIVLAIFALLLVILAIHTLGMKG
jgi:4-amino-4-deoxy-L-arabinose transferase-like glycosyltransferase